ncbi:hypothetical protein C8Q75DRAFT_318312 [Abortiporus biennis]|nr:hypothetical protein C8Q75DRAFT_318312 [Abortiporus biennis]
MISLSVYRLCFFSFTVLTLASISQAAVYSTSSYNETDALDDSQGYLDSRDLLSPLSSPGALLSGILGQRDDVPDQNCTETQTEEDDNNRTIILEARDVFSPKITKPDAFTVWVINTTVTVTWDTCNAPDDITNPQGKILLGHMDNGDDEDENLDIDHPLAEGFDIFQGSVDIVVPDVQQGNDYIIVLMGDSGNKSPPFTIN